MLISRALNFPKAPFLDMEIIEVTINRTFSTELEEPILAQQWAAYLTKGLESIYPGVRVWVGGSESDLAETVKVKTGFEDQDCSLYETWVAIDLEDLWETWVSSNTPKILATCLGLYEIRMGQAIVSNGLTSLERAEEALEGIMEVLSA